MKIVEEVVHAKVIKNLLVDENHKMFVDSNEQADLPILRLGWALTRIFEN